MENNRIDKLAHDEFSRMVHEAKTLQRKDRKDAIRIGKKDILKQRLVQLYVSGTYTNSQIASIMCVSKQTIDKLLKQPEILDMINSYQSEEKEYVDARLKALRQKSLDTMFELLDSEEDAVRLNAAKDVLDRTGHAMKKDSNININVSYEERINELASTADLSYIDTSYVVIDDEEQNKLLEGK